MTMRKVVNAAVLATAAAIALASPAVASTTTPTVAVQGVSTAPHQHADVRVASDDDPLLAKVILELIQVIKALG
ncbi:hypothetical protein ABT104_33955 [Streptomyces mobaraensis]|uniref:hypothetical protein n=1 Tax=Streptomyces mobaraensis TaxID=35621 RepID=UPI00332A40EE